MARRKRGPILSLEQALLINPDLGKYSGDHRLKSCDAILNALRRKKVTAKGLQLDKLNRLIRELEARRAAMLIA